MTESTFYNIPHLSKKMALIILKLNYNLIMITILHGLILTGTSLFLERESARERESTSTPGVSHSDSHLLRLWNRKGGVRQKKKAKWRKRGCEKRVRLWTLRVRQNVLIAHSQIILSSFRHSGKPEIKLRQAERHI